jgi:hypothetical protein
MTDWLDGQAVKDIRAYGQEVAGNAYRRGLYGGLVCGLIVGAVTVAVIWGQLGIGCR